MYDKEYLHQVGKWCRAVFGDEIASNVKIRNFRFLEEALELVQSLGCSREDATRLVDYVFNRPVGEPTQEMGGTFVTLYALAAAAGLEPAMAGWDEFNRCCQPDVIAKIRAKQKLKPNPEDALPFQHIDDIKVNEFAEAMKAKLKRARETGMDGWQSCDIAQLQEGIVRQLDGGDPLDVANYCMFLWHRNETVRVRERVVDQEPFQPQDANFPKAVMPLVQQTLDQEPDSYKIDSSGEVAVHASEHYRPMDTCPVGVKVLLLGTYGTATLGSYNGRDPQWRGWYPLPKELK